MAYGFFAVSGVRTKPGAIVTTRIPALRNSTRRLSQYVIAADFDAQYAADPGRPRTPATLAMPTNVPRARARIGAMNG